MKKLNLFLVVVILVITGLIVYNRLMKPPYAPDVTVEHNGVTYNTLKSSFCWSEKNKGICVDTINIEEFDYESSNAVIDADINDEIIVDVPDDFNEEDIKIVVDPSDINSIYTLYLTSDKGNVNYHFYIK